LERVLMALGKGGADRQVMHERLRQHALQAWSEVQAGRANPLVDHIAADPVLLTYLPGEALRSLMDASAHLGDAPARARQMAVTVRSTCS
jgi:adenylosuccinate lyase